MAKNIHHLFQSHIRFAISSLFQNQFDIFLTPFLAILTGEKFGFDARNAVLTNEEGSEIDSIDVIRDNDKLFFS